MSQYPVFSGSPFAANANQLPFNLNQNLNIPSQTSPFQQNANMSFLNFPPPSLPGSHHVFQNGPRFPGAINTIQPPVFPTNALGNPNMIASSVFATNVPNGNIISPSPFASNSTFPVLTSVPPPIWKPTAFNQVQSPKCLNGSSNFISTGSLSGNFQQTPQKINAQNINPWSSVPSNNFQNSTSDSINAWTLDPSQKKSSFNTFQSLSNNSSPTIRNSVSPWASDSNSHNFQGTPMQIQKSPSKFRQSKSPASDIDPWVQPPVLTGSATGNYQLSNEHGRYNQHNKFNKPNFNNQRGNSRFFSNNYQNRMRQDRNFQGGDFKRESNKSMPYSCDTCDRAFASEDEFRDHMAEHIKCSSLNCTFEAHPKVVALHKRMQHDTGYADVINKLKNVDEIEKWRAERRRRFPTAANILKRKAEQAEKEARGEVIENKEFGKFKRQNTGQGEQRNNRFGNRKRTRKNKRNNRMDASRTSLTVTDSGSDSDDDSHIKLRKFSGILAVSNVFNPVTEESSSIHNLPEESGEPEKVSTSESSRIENLDSYEQEKAEEKESTNYSENIESMDQSIEGSASSNPINIESDDDAPIEFTIAKKQSNLSKQHDIDSGDESPIEIPVSKVSLNEISNSANVVAKNLHVDAKKGDTDSEDESPIVIPVSKVPLNEISNSANVVAKDLHVDAKKGDTESDDDSPTEIPVSKVPLNEISNSTSIVAVTKSPIDDKNGHAGRNFSKTESHRRNSSRKNEPHCVNPVRKSSLLEKLLADDIRHERNVIMQCIRHIVKKKYFGISSDA